MQHLSVHILKAFEPIMLLAFLFLQMVLCVPCKLNIIEKTVSKYKSITDEPVPFDYLIQKWENEHNKLYQEEMNEDKILKWPFLENKKVDIFCQKYLHQCVTGRTTKNATGIKQFKELHYQREHKNAFAIIEVLTCKTSKMFFYITRAPEPNCVFACTSDMSKVNSVYLINKHCDFEQHEYIKSGKQKNLSEKEIHHLHNITKQPIAPDELLQQHELDHFKLFQIENTNITWSHVKTLNNIDEYCKDYIQKCVPNKNFTCIVGRWRTGNVKYYKENEGKLTSTIILQCKCSYHLTTRNYYLTRAFEPNCVYALLRTEGKYLDGPYQIIYKHCDIIQTNLKLEALETSSVSDQNLKSYKNIKTRDYKTMETLQLFPSY